MLEGRIPPEMYGTQVYVFSDWIRNVYDPNECRCQACTDDALRRLGKRPRASESLARLRISDPPFRFAVYAFWKSEHMLNAAETFLLDRLGEHIGG